MIVDYHFIQIYFWGLYYMGRLSNKVAIITGAAQGMGAAHARIIH